MASKEVEFQSGKPKKTGVAARWDGTKSFLYNKESKTFCGRTCNSWGKIGIFYLIYYGCLAAFFAICLLVFFETLDDVEPRLKGMHSLLKGNPGMGFRPMPRLKSTLIKFDMDDSDTYDKYVEHISEYVNKYNDAEYLANSEDCGPNGERKQEVMDAGKFCRFSVGKDESCDEASNYGYGIGEPCILLKLNKIYGWDPDTFDNNTILEDDKHAAAARDALGDNVDPNYIGITCEGENVGDQDHRGTITLYPALGIPTWYFPFMNQDGYLPPYVFAKFNNLREGVIVQMWCKAWTRNIYHHKNDKAGSIHLEILMD